MVGCHPGSESGGRIASCVLCHSDRLELLFAAGGQPVEQCQDCSLVFLNPPPACSDEQLYAEAYYRGDCSVKRDGQENVLEPARVARRLDNCRGVVAELERALGRRGRWLDLGCGPGFLLKAAQDAGWTATGVDVSAFAAAHAREQFGLRDVTAGPLETAAFPVGAFDVVTLQHVIEHFRDPVTMIQRITEWLAPGGLLWLQTPDIDSGRARRERAAWVHVKVPEHLFYFNERTLRRLLSGQGLEVVGVRREVEGTGLMEKACGGAAGARRFYDRALRVPGGRLMIQGVRAVNEWYRARVKGESDVICLLARKA